MKNVGVSVRVLLLCILTLLAFSLAARAADAPAPPPDPTAGDARLDQKVTYEAQQGRLHKIASDLTALTGVTIRTGRNDQDWRVRDIPMTVHVDGLQLGVLIKALAQTAHLQLSAESVRTDNGNTHHVYRLSRDRKLQAEIDTNFEMTRHEATARLSWAWDVLMRYAAQPGSKEPSSEKPRAWNHPTPAMCRMIARLLAGLGADQKERVFAGDTVTVSALNSDPTLLASFYRAAWTQNRDLLGRRSSGARADPEPRAKDMSDARINICTIRDDAGSPTYIQLAMGLRMSDRVGSGWNEGLEHLASVIAASNKDAGLPPRPQEKARSLYDFPVPKGLLEASNLWEYPSASCPRLDDRIRLGLPSSNEKPRFCEFICALAKAAKLNVVVDDYISQRFVGHDFVTKYAGEEMAVRKLFVSIYGFDWTIDPPQDLALGSANDWVIRQANLVPESLVDYLRQKAGTVGVELDDVMLLEPYSARAFGEWSGPDLGMVRCAWDAKPLWRLYAHLSQADRARARSEAGLPLSSLDTNWIKGLFQSTHDDSVYADPQAEERARKEYQATRDPAALSALIFRVVAKKTTSYVRAVPFNNGKAGGYAGLPNIQFIANNTARGELPNGQFRTHYQAQIEGSDGPPAHVDSLDGDFPLYSPKRDAEVLSLAQPPPVK